MQSKNPARQVFIDVYGSDDKFNIEWFVEPIQVWH